MIPGFGRPGSRRPRPASPALFLRWNRPCLPGTDFLRFPISPRPGTSISLGSGLRRASSRSHRPSHTFIQARRSVSRTRCPAHTFIQSGCSASWTRCPAHTSIKSGYPAPWTRRPAHACIQAGCPASWTRCPAHTFIHTGRASSRTRCAACIRSANRPFPARGCPAPGLQGYLADIFHFLI